MQKAVAALVLVLFMVLQIPILPAAQQQKFITLRSGSYGPGYKFSTKSTVEILESKDPRVQKLVAFITKLEKKFGSLDKNGPFYLYTYTFISRGRYKLKVNFSEWELVHSPLTDIIQDFSFVMQPGETKVIRFVAAGNPRTVLTQINIGVWKKDSDFYDSERWYFYGAGSAGFYIPPSIFYVAVP